MSPKLPNFFDSTGLPQAPAWFVGLIAKLGPVYTDTVGVPTQRINELVRGKRGVTPDTAWLLAQAFETTPEFWLNLQNNHDLSALEPKRTVTKLKSVTPDG